MLRLKREDFDDPHDVAKLAATAHLSLDEFRDQFAYLTEDEPTGPVATSGAVRASRSE